MDGDPAVESELDGFSRTFPLPYRVAFIVVLAVWGWGLNLHYLYLLKIDVPALIRYPSRTSASQPPHHIATYRLAAFLSISYGISISFFWLLTRRDAAAVVEYDWLPMTYLLVLAALFVIPFRNLSVSHTGRGRVLSVLKRISVGAIGETKDSRFADLLLADVLTSYAKVLGDLFVCICMFIKRGGSATDRPDRNCGGEFFVPLILAYPSAIRLSQCVVEYRRLKLHSFGIIPESKPWYYDFYLDAHLSNALKYASAFPVIIFSALQRNLDTDDTTKTWLYRAWILAVTINSLFSFYWDIARDWDLTLFDSRSRNSAQHAFGLRRKLALGPPAVYYLAIAVDLVLRFSWSLKLSPHLDHVFEFESSIFLIQFAEVFRRWVWIFFRVETEWIRSSTNGLAPDDILLAEWDGKSDDDD